METIFTSINRVNCQLTACEVNSDRAGIVTHVSSSCADNYITRKIDRQQVLVQYRANKKNIIVITLNIEYYSILECVNFYPQEEIFMDLFC